MQLTFVGSVGSVGRWDYGAWVGYAALAYGKRLAKGKKLTSRGTLGIF